MELQVGCSNLRAQRVGAVATPLFPTLGVPLLLSLPVITGRPRAASPHHVAGRSGNVIVVAAIIFLDGFETYSRQFLGSSTPTLSESLMLVYRTDSFSTS